MPALILYLLKANVALVLFYLAYHVALRRLTFYHLNRLFLLFGILFSTLYPFIDLSELFSQHQELKNTYLITIPTWTASLAVQEQAPAFDYWLLPVFLFWTGTAVMAIRLLLQFVSLYRIHASSEPKEFSGIGFREIQEITQAFSFWQTIYLNPSQHKQEELESILRHELIHVKGWHTLDVLLTELSTVFYWFNPGVWLMKNAVKENLEFIADQNVVNTGIDKKEYQYLLLKVVGATQPQIANQFNFPSLIRRIAMMNKMPTSRANQLRLLIALPLITVLLFAFKNASDPIESVVDKMRSAGIGEVTTDTDKQHLSEDYKDFFKRNPTVMAIYWVPDVVTGKKSKIRRIVVEQRNNIQNFQIKQASDITRFVATFGILPAIPAESINIIQVKNPAFTESHQQVKPDAYEAFLKRNPTVQRIFWTADLDDRKSKRVFLIIENKSGSKERVPLADVRSIRMAEEKYGKLPAPPATPPQVDASVLPTPPHPIEVSDTDPIQPTKKQEGERIIFPADIDYYQIEENLPPNYRNFLKRNPSVEKVGWKLVSNKGPQAIIIQLKSGASDTYTLNDPKSVAAAESKYGRLPDLLPPPHPSKPEKPGTPPPPPAEPTPPVPPAPPGGEHLPAPPPPLPADIPVYIPGASNQHDDHKAFLKRNPEVKEVGWIMQEHNNSNLRLIVFYLEGGNNEIYDLNNKESIASAEKKYGKLPGLPAPPPPVRKNN